MTPNIIIIGFVPPPFSDGWQLVIENIARREMERKRERERERVGGGGGEEGGGGGVG